MTVKHKCSGRTVTQGGWGSYPCSRNATVERDGKRYCWQHDPERMEAEAKKRRAGWQAEMDRETAKYERIARNARLGKLVTPELAALLERLAEWADEAVIDGGYCLGEDMGTSSYENHGDIANARTLAARIYEALEVTE